jgi:hypothetical protein
MPYLVKALRDGAIVFEGAATSPPDALNMAQYASALERATVTVSDVDGKEVSAVEFADTIQRRRRL